MLCPCSVRVMGEVRSYPWLNASSDLDNCNSFAMCKKKIPVETSYNVLLWSSPAFLNAYVLCFFFFLITLVHNNVQGLSEQICYKTRAVKVHLTPIFFFSAKVKL